MQTNHYCDLDSDGYSFGLNTPLRRMRDNALCMAETFPILSDGQNCGVAGQRTLKRVQFLQVITLAWMAMEAGISIYAATTAGSVALLAFGADSLVELLSAVVVLRSVSRTMPIPRERAARWAGVLLFALAAAVAITAARALLTGAGAEATPVGIAVTIAALLVMPLLAWFKRKLGKETHNRALMADAVQSATCAYLAAITLVSLVINAAFHIRWIDPAAALAVLPILIIEGRRALRGDPCTCC